jgi:integrase/recombinase XerD
VEELEPEVEEYLKLKGKSTRISYASAFRKFVEYYKQKHGKDHKAFSDFLDTIYAELRKPPREQKMVTEAELGEFINFLKQKGKSANSIRVYVAAMQNFLKYKHITVSTGFIGNMPAPVTRKQNGKHKWTIKQIKKFVDAAKSYRDKALILCMFQSGLAVNEICELICGDIQEEFEKGILPLCLRIVRKKTKVEFYTFFGRDAVKYLRLYLATRTDLTPESPLFTKVRARGGDERITTAAIQATFSELAKELPFIKNNGDGYNPARPHSLRAAFNSQLINKIDGKLREFWMGHSIGSVAGAYLNMPTEEMRKLYMTAEQYLAIEKTSRDELDEKAKEVKLPPEVDEKIKLLSSEVERFRDELASSKAEIKESEERIESMYAYVHKTFDPLLEFVDAISEYPEFEEIKRKLLEAKADKDRIRVDEQQRP